MSPRPRPVQQWIPTPSPSSRPMTRPRTPKRPSYRAARAFYLTLLLGACLFAYISLTNHHDDTPSLPLLSKRQDPPGEILQTPDEKCRLVHHAPPQKQCAFIHKNCPLEDEPGFAFHLDLYFCTLQNAKPVAALILVGVLGILFTTIGIAASDFFCINLSTIASILGMSESMAGVTLLAFGNGSPDVFSTFAAMSTNSGSLAVGELFGAAGFITAVVAGSMALIRPFHVARKSFIRDVGFFAVAAAFSMVFLWDGKLHLWECIAMVLFYIAYVTFVVAWHWWIGRRRRRREKDAAIRGHYLAPEDEYGVEEEYRDDPSEVAGESARRPSYVRGLSVEDWSALESQNQPYTDGSAGSYPDEDEEEEARDRWMSELNSNMRLTRPRVHSRKNTISSVRPSLVGALEFQAVMKSLQKSRNIQTIPLNARRYSDDPTFTTAQQQDLLSSPSVDPAPRPAFSVTIDAGGEAVVEGPTAGLGLEVPKSAPATSGGRMRAVSANDAAGLGLDPAFGERLERARSPGPGPSLRGGGDLIDFSGNGDNGQRTTGRSRAPSASAGSLLAVPGQSSQPQSPILQLTPPDARGSPDLRLDTSFSQDQSHLAPQGGRSPIFRSPSNDHIAPRSILRTPTIEGSMDSPRAVPTARQLPKIIIPREQRSRASSRASSPFPSPFPKFQDDITPPATSTGPPSLHLPPSASSIASPESLPFSQAAEQEQGIPQSKPLRYWPYSIAPPPGVIISTLFPTIYHWHEKTWWEKCLGLVAAPSVFLLTITLPVVENDKDGESEGDGVGLGGAGKGDSYDSAKTGISAGNNARSKSLGGGLETAQSGEGLKGVSHDSDGETPVDESVPGSHRHSHHNLGALGPGAGVASLAAETEWHERGNAGEGDQTHYRDHHHHHHHDHQQYHGPMERTASPAPIRLDNPAEPVEEMPVPELWNRWLTILHLYLAPIFVEASIYSQSASATPRWLVRPTLVCLLISTVLLIPLILTTTPTHRPRVYATILSLAGFVVSIAWISTIAAQVVGALKALAVIANMSHAIMGLTIFAVGNSLGDLVADVTVARLGYPVMALSACFGGPMLNILLGIGLSGSWILITGAEHRHERHPDRDFRFKSYHIDVSTTLIVSGATLLVTLVGLLVAVPMNKWVLSRRIGWCLIGVWVVSTVGNVVVEVLGVGSDS